jgi:TonB family protein
MPTLFSYSFQTTSQRTLQFCLLVSFIVHTLVLGFRPWVSLDKTENIQPLMSPLTLTLQNEGPLLLNPQPHVRVKKQAIQASINLNSPSVKAKNKQEKIQENTVEVVSSSSPISGEYQEKDYTNYIRSEFAKHKFYPLKAKRLQQTGLVVIDVLILPNGHVHDAHISEPCPFDSLNQAALTAIKNVTRVSPPPLTQGKDYLIVKVPMEFELL